MALSRHYSENHGTINKPPLHEAYTEVKVRRNGPERRSGEIIVACTAFRLEFQVRWYVFVFLFLFNSHSLLCR